MSGSSDYTTTPNLGLFKPNYDADDGMWGTHLNANADALDAALSTGTGGKFLPLTGGTVQPPNMTSTTFNAAQFITSTATGSGTNGPQTAQIGLNISHQKQDYLTTSAVGEVDGLYVTARQGGPGSDVGGILVDVGNTGNGFTAILEGSSAQMAPTTGAVTRQVRVQLGGLNPQSSDYDGLLLQAQSGTSSRALLINDVAGQGQWTNFIEGWLSGSENFVVTNGGGIYAAGGLQTGTAGQVQVQGHVPVASPGSYLAYNRGANGTTYLLTNRGGGSAGGFQFADVNNSDALTVLLAVFSTGIYFQPIPVFLPTNLVNATNDAGAATGGVGVNQMYRNGSALMVRVA